MACPYSVIECTQYSTLREARKIDTMRAASCCRAGYGSCVSLDRPRSIAVLGRESLGHAAPRSRACQGSRASALLSVVNCSRRRGLVSPLGCPADLGTFPNGSPQREVRASRRAPAMAGVVGGRPSVAPKRHEVGRVARRARPFLWRHISTLRNVTPPYPKGGA